MGEGGYVRKRKLRDSPIGQFKLEGDCLKNLLEVQLPNGY